MIRTLAIAFALSTSFIALSATQSFAQTTNPDTGQTDQSEEDWRKSKKKKDTSDIFEDILNNRGFGQGTNQQYPQSPMDSLPEESRRHLMKERAKIIAESEPGKPADTGYKPSEAAKTDPDLAEQEKEAWTVIVTDMQGGGSGGQPGDGPNKIAVAGQGSSGGQSSGTMRGGSTQSVADILAQIKGMKSAGGGAGTVPGQGSGQGPLGQGQSQGQSQGQGTSDGADQTTNGQSESGQSQSASAAQAKANAAAKDAVEARARADSASQAASEAASRAQTQSDADAKAESDAKARAAAEAESEAKAAEKAAAQAQAQAQAQAEQTAQSQAMAEAKSKQALEPIGPLERIKAERDSQTSGTQTSASDFLKKK